MILLADSFLFGCSRASKQCKKNVRESEKREPIFLINDRSRTHRFLHESAILCTYIALVSNRSNMS